MKCITSLYFVVPIVLSISSCGNKTENTNGENVDSSAFVNTYMQAHPEKYQEFRVPQPNNLDSPDLYIAVTSKGIRKFPDPEPAESGGTLITNYQTHRIEAGILAPVAWLVSTRDIESIMTANPDYIQIFLARDMPNNSPDVTLVLAGVKKGRNGNAVHTTFTSSGVENVVEHVIPCPDCEALYSNGKPRYNPSIVPFDNIHTEP